MRRTTGCWRHASRSRRGRSPMAMGKETWSVTGVSGVQFASTKSSPIVIGPERMTVAETNALLYTASDPRDQLQRALRIPALSTGWRTSLEALLERVESGTPRSGEHVGTPRIRRHRARSEWEGGPPRAAPPLIWWMARQPTTVPVTRLPPFFGWIELPSLVPRAAKRLALSHGAPGRLSAERSVELKNCR